MGVVECGQGAGGVPSGSKGALPSCGAGTGIPTAAAAVVAVAAAVSLVDCPCREDATLGAAQT